MIEPASGLLHTDLAELRHNLRTSINHILGYTEILIEDASEARNARALDALRHIHSACLGALRDINEGLANRETINRSELANLTSRIQPRFERILTCAQVLTGDAQVRLPLEWLPDVNRISGAARILLRLLSGSPATPDEEPKPDPAVLARLPHQPSRARMLVVDDNEHNRNMLSRRLERQGYQVAVTPEKFASTARARTIL